MAQHLNCPHCGQQIDLDEALSHQLEAQFARQLAQEKATLAKQNDQIQQKLAAQEKDLANQKAKLQQDLEQQVAAKLAQETKVLQTQLKKELADQQNQELTLLKTQLDQKEQKLAQAQALELKLRQERLELETAKKEQALTLQRQLDEEREKIAQAAGQKAIEQQHHQLAELQKQLLDANKANQELTRKLQQGSQQNQGEVLELELEEQLRQQFPHDQIQPVAKGINGADIEQIVQTQFGQLAGKIVWELKQTKAFSPGWIEKLKADQRQSQAELAILVTSVLPSEVKNFGFYQGIWLCQSQFALPLAVALRQQLLVLAREKQATQGKEEKMEQLYQYITGTQFRQRIEGIVEAFTHLKSDLETEKRAYQKIWAKREKQLDQVLNQTIGLQGNLEGLVGAGNLPALESLELTALAEAD